MTSVFSSRKPLFGSMRSRRRQEAQGGDQTCPGPQMPAPALLVITTTSRAGNACGLRAGLAVEEAPALVLGVAEKSQGEQTGASWP